MPNKAPVDAVGGTQSDGPWPDHVGELKEGAQHDREVKLADGSVQTVTVKVTRVEQVTDREGVDPEDEAYAVSFTYDDPTVDGEGT